MHEPNIRTAYFLTHITDLSLNHISFGMINTRVMQESDLPFFMKLMDIVGWGMTSQDYQRILHLSPEGCFIASQNKKDLGIVTTTNYGNIAWIGNLVVLPETRGQGIGLQLMQHAIDYLKSTGTKSIRLDGVPLAIPLYHRLGFRDEYKSLRYTGKAHKQPSSAKQMKPHHINQVARLDESIFRAPRKKILKYFYKLHPEFCFTAWEKNKLVGYIMAKPGKTNIKIGPWLAEPRHICAEQLLYAVMNQIPGSKIWVGLPENNAHGIEILEKNGFTRNTSSLRMCLGDCKITEKTESVYCLGGPDKG